jgi:hypothetical protein
VNKRLKEGEKSEERGLKEGKQSADKELKEGEKSEERGLLVDISHFLKMTRPGVAFLLIVEGHLL